MKFIIGIFIVALGASLVIKTEWYYQNFGTIAWAEEKLGPNGGSRLMYKLLGLIAIFFGFLLMSGLFGGFLVGTVGRILVR